MTDDTLHLTAVVPTEPEGRHAEHTMEETRSVRQTAAARLAPHAQRARTVFEQQRCAAGQRVRGWFAGADLTDQFVAGQVTERKRRAAQEADDALIRQVARLRGRLAEARARAAAQHGDKDVSSPEVERLTGELTAAEARMETRAAEGPQVAVLPPTRREIGLARWRQRAIRTGVVVVGGLAWLKGVSVEPLLMLATAGAAPLGWWWLARPLDQEDQNEGAEVAADRPKVSLVKQRTTAGEPTPAPYGGTVADAPRFDAPPPPALTEQVLTNALRAAGAIASGESVTVLSAPPYAEDGTANIVFDLPPGGTVKALKSKAEALAGALGRDLTMVDIGKAGAAGRVSLWISDTDPFEEPRRSPLLAHSGGIDAWGDGVPVAWAKRGSVIALPIRNSSFLIGGMTRSGKGVGMANLAAGAALDVRVNLRIVAGKDNGEFDAYAKAGIPATYFKQRPHRLRLLTDALLSDMQRRNRILGELGKSKMTAETIDRLGGIELVIVDELATFTAKDSHDERDELLENLMQLAAVAASSGILLCLTTQYPEVNVVPNRLALNLGTRWAMRVDTAGQSNTILGGGASGAGRDASKFDPPRPGLGWLVNPFAGVTDLARSFDLDEDERGEVFQLATRAADLRQAAGRLPDQWDDPIENHLLRHTGQSSAAGGPDRNGTPGRVARHLTAEDKAAYDALAAAVEATDAFGRDAQLDEMADCIGSGMTGERLGELLRAAGAGGTVKITVDGRRVNGYRREMLTRALQALDEG